MADINGLTNEQLNRMMMEAAMGMADIGGTEKSAQLALLRSNAYRDNLAKGKDTVGNLGRALQLGASGWQQGVAQKGYDAASKQRGDMYGDLKHRLLNQKQVAPQQPGAMTGPVDVMGARQPMPLVPQDTPDQAAIAQALRAFGKPQKQPWELGNDFQPAL